MVLCHLISTGGPTTEGEEKIFKLLGTIIEINTGKVPKIYEDVEKRVAYRVLGDELLIRSKDGGIYQVDANACMVVKESTYKEAQQALGKKEGGLKESISEEVGEAKENLDNAIEEQKRPTVKETTDTISNIVERNLIRPTPTILPKDKKESQKEHVSPAPAPAPAVVAPAPEKVEEKKAEPVAPPAPVLEEVKPVEKPKEPVKEEPKDDKKKGLMDYLLE